MRPTPRINPVQVLSVLLLILPALGCVAFRADDMTSIASWPPPESLGKKTINIVVTGAHLFNGQPFPSDEKQKTEDFVRKRWEAPISQAYFESGYFSEIKAANPDVDVYADVKILEREEGSEVWAFISGFTMTVIPCRATQEFVVQTTFKDREGKVLGTIEKSEKSPFWFQLFLVFAMPTNSMGQVWKDIVSDLNRATILEAHDKGFL